MRKLVLIEHISLDGFVAFPGGELDGFEIGEENLAFVCRITEDADAALFGRISYQLLNNYWPQAKARPNATKGEIAYSNWYCDAQKIIVSETLQDELMPNTTIIRKNVKDEISSIKEQAGKDILVFGSPSVAQLLIQENLVDGYWIFVNPVIFGQGIPLFTNPLRQVKLALKTTQPLPNGEIAMYYSVKR